MYIRDVKLCFNCNKEFMNYPELNQLSNVLCLEGEVWKDIKGFDGYYQVSNLGRVKRLNCVSRRGIKFQENVLKANNDSRGYPQVSLNFNKTRVARVHRLVVEAFLSEPSPELVAECKASGLSYVLVNHLDENPLNAKISNLEWCSPVHNATYGKSRKANPRVSGSASKVAVLNEADVSEIIRLLEVGNLSQEKIAEMFGVKQITISNIWTGRSWSHLTGIPWKERPRRGRLDVKKLSEQNFVLH